MAYGAKTLVPIIIIMVSDRRGDVNLSHKLCLVSYPPIFGLFFVQKSRDTKWYKSECEGMVNFTVIKYCVPIKLAQLVDLVLIYLILLVLILAHLSFSCPRSCPF